MASYGASVRRITTAEINRLLREGGYSRWAYFVDEAVDRTGVIFANDTDFAAYYVDDEPDPKLHEFGHEKITDLLGEPDPEYLVLTAGQNEFAAVVFSDPVMVDEDDFSESFNYDVLHDWQRFLLQHGLQLKPKPEKSFDKRKLVMGAIIGLIIIFAVIAILNMRTAP